MGGSEQLARLAGAVAGLGIAFAAAFPFNGVPPHGVSGRPVPAQVEVRVLASGVLTLDPVGVGLRRTAFPAPGVRGGPSLSVKATNISPVPLRLSMRLTGLSPALDDSVTVRASGAGAVLVSGPLGGDANWSKPAGLLPVGATTTLRLRFKLKPGISPDDFSGRLDVRQLEVEGAPVASGPGATTPITDPAATSPAASSTSPAPTTPATSPAQPTSAATTPVPSTTPRRAGH